MGANVQAARTRRDDRNIRRGPGQFQLLGDDRRLGVTVEAEGVFILPKWARG